MRKFLSSSFMPYVLLLIVIKSAENSQIPEFIVHPESINTTDGTTVNFTCIANNNPLTVNFNVNGTGLVNTDKEKGFTELPTDDNLGGGKRRRILTVIASVADNNNSRIACHLSYTNISNDVLTGSMSDVALLLVQGPLPSIADLSYSFIDSSSVNISWSPPFTLPGTNITGYNISVTGNGTTTNYFTSDSYYVLLLTDITDSPCNEIIITVSGYNGLDGENESLTGIYLPSAIINNPVPMSVSISSEKQLSAVFNFTDLCIGEHPESANFFLFNDGRLVNSTDNPSLFVSSGDNFVVENILTVSINTNYTLIATLGNLAGNFNFNSTKTFNTFSIESATVTDTTNGRVCVECVFHSFSTDTECTLKVVFSETVQYTETFSRSSDSTVASGCISDVVPGVYSISILNENGKVFKMSLLEVTNMVTTTASTPGPSDIPAPSSSPTVNSARSGLSGGSIAGIVIAGILTLLAPIGGVLSYTLPFYC